MKFEILSGPLRQWLKASKYAVAASALGDAGTNRPCMVNTRSGTRLEIRSPVGLCFAKVRVPGSERLLIGDTYTW